MESRTEELDGHSVWNHTKVFRFGVLTDQGNVAPVERADVACRTLVHTFLAIENSGDGASIRKDDMPELVQRSGVFVPDTPARNELGHHHGLFSTEDVFLLFSVLVPIPPVAGWNLLYLDKAMVNGNGSFVKDGRQQCHTGIRLAGHPGPHMLDDMKFLS